MVSLTSEYGNKYGESLWWSKPCTPWRNSCKLSWRFIAKYSSLAINTVNCKLCCREEETSRIPLAMDMMASWLSSIPSCKLLIFSLETVMNEDRSSEKVDIASPKWMLRSSSALIWFEICLISFSVAVPKSEREMEPMKPNDARFDLDFTVWSGEWWCDGITSWASLRANSNLWLFLDLNRATSCKACWIYKQVLAAVSDRFIQVLEGFIGNQNRSDSESLPLNTGNSISNVWAQ